MSRVRTVFVHSMQRSNALLERKVLRINSATSAQAGVLCSTSLMLLLKRVTPRRPAITAPIEYTVIEKNLLIVLCI